MSKLLLGSRYLIYLPIIGSLLASVLLMVYGLLEIVNLFRLLIQAGIPDAAQMKYLAADITKVVDLFLLSAVLYIIAIGLDELFIDEDLPVPRWLGIHSLDDLKDKLMTTVALLLVVYFLGYYAEWAGGIDILWAGLAVAAVLVPVVFLVRRDPHRHSEESSHKDEQE